MRIACPKSLVSVPLFSLSKDWAPGGATHIPRATINVTSTGREALDLLIDGQADFALATKAAFDSIDSVRRESAFEIAEVSSHSMSSLVYSVKSDIAASSVREIKRQIEDGRSALYVTQLQTNYDRYVSEVLKRQKHCKRLSIRYDDSNFSVSNIESIVAHELDYIVFLGLHTWLDEIETRLADHSKFSARFVNKFRFETGYGREVYSLFASDQSVGADKREILNSFRDLIVYLDSFSQEPVKEFKIVHSKFNSHYRSELQQGVRYGDLEAYLKEIDLCVTPRMTSRVAQIWSDEIRHLAGA